MSFQIADYIIPIIILLILFAALVKRAPAFDIFAKGASGGFSLCLSILPFIATVLIAVALLRTSGLASWLTLTLRPVFDWVGIPPELSELIVLRPFSGSGSLALYKELVAVHGADAYITRCAAVIMSSSETIFYVTGVYLASTRVRRLRYCIPVALIAAFFGTIVSCWLCRFM